MQSSNSSAALTSSGILYFVALYIVMVNNCKLLLDRFSLFYVRIIDLI
jgi:hypothetical protein